ncbi:MAG: lytic transglycosylase domain-containing protein [Candidatus Gastranaerophilales bacterium]|nr:lytic transglycosylase domain-containing protein [Candidatus Gastranaerophilales bacterium]
MFSQNIQNLINTSGKEAAIKRAAQINTYVNNLEKSVLEEPSNNTVQPFSDVLKSSNAIDSKFKVLNADDVNAVSALPSVKHGVKASKSQIMNIISHMAKKYDIDEKLIKALVKQESGFRSDAVSSCGAIGLMQLMPATARGLGVKDPFDPIQNIEGGVKYLKSKLKRHNGNLILALAAYNAGSGNVDKYNGVPPFKETQNYVKSILANYLG